MMKFMRSNSFVLQICIISTLFNWQACAGRAEFALANNGADDNRPAYGLTDDAQGINEASFQQTDTFNAHKKSINESSRRVNDFVSISEYVGYDVGNRYENSDKSIETGRQKRTTPPQDICETNECKCKFELKFLTVECDFHQDYHLGTSKMIRPTAETLLITLSSDANFHLDGNVLSNNRLNRIMIQGSGQQHVEIASNAFNGNGGIFPEIEIVNVHSVDIQPNAFYFEFKLNITNCAKVRVFSEAFANTSFHGHFENIQDLHLLERAFSKSNARVTIHNCQLEELKRLDASLKEIKFSNTHIATVLTGAFDVIKIDSIIFENCHIDTIQSNAFTEKLFSHHLSLTDCNIGTIEGGAISGSGISDVILYNNSISNIKSKAITLTSVTLLIQGNNISLTERFWFRVDGWSNVSIDNNHFGVYQQMAIETTKDSNKCVFENNFITKTVSGSLSFKSPNCRIKQVSFDRSCSCNSTYFNTLSDGNIIAESYCKIDTVLSHCFNASLYNVKSYKDDICDETSQIDCVRDRINAKTNGYFIDLDRLFKRHEKLLYVYLGAGLILIFLVFLLLILIIRRCMKSKKDIDDGPTRDSILMESLHPTTATLTTQLYQPHTIQMYQSQTFSDSDLIIINQTLKEMKLKYPPEFYDQIDNNTRKLIVGNLTETDKVKTIGEIVQSLDECENTEIDFVAFTDILYNHLGAGCETTQTQQINGPIYAEPGLVHLDIVNSTNGTRNFIGGDGEHIYAELVNLQQPLLRSEYNVPIDNDANNHLYTEPVTGAIDYISSPPPPTNLIHRNFDPSHLYAKPSKTKLQPTKANCPEPSTSDAIRTLPKISLGERFKNSAHSSSQESNSHSDHSGASGITLPLDEPFEYADA